MLKIEYRIYGHPSRIVMTKDLQKVLALSDSNVFLDDRDTFGPSLYVLKKAFLSAYDEDTTHVLAIPEDMHVCNNFKSIIQRMINAHPKAIIGLFPFDFQNYFPREYKDYNTPYVKVHILSACGIIMPVEYIQDCFKWIKETYNDDVIDDLAIQNWARINNIECITTLPATVQHIGDNSIVTPNAPIRKTKYFLEDMPENINWDSTDVVPANVHSGYDQFCDKINGVYYFRGFN